MKILQEDLENLHKAFVDFLRTIIYQIKYDIYKIFNLVRRVKWTLKK